MEYDTPSRFLKDIDPSLMHVEGNGSSDFSSSSSRWMQNPRPVATQFRADPKPRIVAPHHEPSQAERMQKLHAAVFGTNAKTAPSAPVNSRRGSANAATSSANIPSDLSNAPIKEGNVIEHQRFGIGTVIKVEGTGENTKATVEFRNTGTKQLLMKFAKYKIVR